MQLHCDFACHHVFGENRWRNPQLVGSKNQGKIIEQVNLSPLLFITLVSKGFLCRPYVASFSTAHPACPFVCLPYSVLVLATRSRFAG